MEAFYVNVCCRLPGLESSKNNQLQEDVFYNTMMDSLLRMVLSRTSLGSMFPFGSPETIAGDWEQVKSGYLQGEDQFHREHMFKNLLSWKAHTLTSANRMQIVV